MWLVGIHLAHAMTLDRMIQYTRVYFTSPDFPAQLDGYQVAFITDTHAISDDQLRQVVRRLNDMAIDALLLGGDFERRQGSYRRHIGILSEVLTYDGIWAVEGNHDHGRITRQTMADYGVGLLNNQGVHLQEGLYLAGAEDHWHGRPSFEAALAEMNPSDFVLFLSHNPDASMTNDLTDIHLMLSGHTHGGQINFLGIYAPYLTLSNHPDFPSRAVTRYGQRFKSGFAYGQDEETPVFVSRGTGQEYMRVFSRPEVVILTLNHGAPQQRVAMDVATAVFWAVILGNLVLYHLYWFWKRRNNRKGPLKD